VGRRTSAIVTAGIGGMSGAPGTRVDAWIDALLARHTAALTRPELLRAIRALSVRYVERRAELPRSSPLDSAGKRAAFAVFFAPLHFLTTSAIVESMVTSERHVDELVDLGCGTGVASAAWALADEPRPAITGIDEDRWVLDEAAWNWRALGLRGRTRRGDMVAAAERLTPGRNSPDRRRGVVLGWSANEISEDGREQLLTALVRSPSAVLVIEPIARRVSPWWPAWTEASEAAGGRAREHAFDLPLPPTLARLDEEAGFRREMLKARSLWLPGNRTSQSG
jgi:hypothetical protein